MSVFLRKSEWLDDWYVVDGCSATPEGTAEEWIAKAETLLKTEMHCVEGGEGI